MTDDAPHGPEDQHRPDPVEPGDAEAAHTEPAHTEPAPEAPGPFGTEPTHAEPATGPIPLSAAPRTGEPPRAQQTGQEPPWQARPSGALAAPHGLHPDQAANPWQRPGPPSPAGTPNAPDATGAPGAPGATGSAQRPASAWPGAGQAGWQLPWTGPGGAPGSGSYPGVGPTPTAAHRPGQAPMASAPGPSSPLDPTHPGAPAPARSTRTALVMLAVVVLALIAGFGGGMLGSSLAGRDAGSASDDSLTQHPAGQPASESTAAPTGSVQAVADKVLPSVVSVVALGNSGEDEGSGVILTDSGLILTNNHVIDGAQHLTVQFTDGTTATATVVGTDPTDDLAVIKVDGVSGLQPATLGTSADLQVGQQVVAVGSPLGLSATVTTGIVSALNRPVRTSSAGDSGQPAGEKDTVLNAIQTDAAINPGNSGGPLVNMNGDVIGINSAIATLSTGSSGQSGSIGVGFAIPIDQAHRIAQEIINTGKASHAVLGATVFDALNRSDGITTGAAVKEVTPDGGADKAGIKAGDVITKVGDAPVESADALVATIRSSKPGGTIQVSYTRDGKSSTVTVRLGSATD